jgi:hypothetical protein
MALIDVDGMVLGSAALSGQLGNLVAFAGATSGSSDAAASIGIDHLLSEAVAGTALVSGAPGGLINLSGATSGASQVTYGSLSELAGTAAGASQLDGQLERIIELRGFAVGSSLVITSEPERILGIAVVSGFMEVICTPYPVCQTPQVQLYLRWGQQFGPDNLSICITGNQGNPLGPVCISYTLYQFQPGCALKQVGPSGRKPGNSSVGCYYATGTAGDCGQPGLWLIRWLYQKTFGSQFIERDCYFYVLDSVLCPVPGDTLPRACKYGWD